VIRDVRAQVAAGEALDRAARLVDQWREAIASGGQRLAEFGERVRALQEEMDRLGRDDGAALTDLKKRVAALCGEILEAVEG
jgi:hypothetical protein